MTDKTFFEKCSEQSHVKSEIISNYLWSWAKIIISKLKPSNIVYIDLFAGPGCYEDLSPSTPILVLNKAINDKDIRDKLLIEFNDKDTKLIQKLEYQISKIQNIDKLKYPPNLYNIEVSENILSLLQQYYAYNGPRKLDKIFKGIKLM